ncbi:unnamed protein product [Linum tenue]|uniref:Ribosome-associated protein quality control protein P2 RNA-binding domain-containing protein n=1 Tax=Linum tenue TaxID=586396 RepID=A0AAV0M4Y4_9ROSI|nr:unnamed protein product [Linum tenue]
MKTFANLRWPGLLRANNNKVSATRATRDRQSLHADFLSLPTVRELMFELEKLADSRAVGPGGYPRAKAIGNFGFVSCTHCEFLGSIVGTGIVWEKVGDVLLLQGGKGTQFLVVPELADFMISSLGQVRSVSVCMYEDSPA